MALSAHGHFSPLVENESQLKNQEQSSIILIRAPDHYVYSYPNKDLMTQIFIFLVVMVTWVSLEMVSKMIVGMAV